MSFTLKIVKILGFTAIGGLLFAYIYFAFLQNSANSSESSFTANIFLLLFVITTMSLTLGLIWEENLRNKRNAPQITENVQKNDIGKAMQTQLEQSVNPTLQQLMETTSKTGKIVNLGLENLSNRVDELKATNLAGNDKFSTSLGDISSLLASYFERSGEDNTSEIIPQIQSQTQNLNHLQTQINDLKDVVLAYVQTGQVAAAQGSDNNTKVLEKRVAILQNECDNISAQIQDFSAKFDLLMSAFTEAAGGEYQTETEPNYEPPYENPEPVYAPEPKLEYPTEEEPGAEWVEEPETVSAQGPEQVYAAEELPQEIEPEPEVPFEPAEEPEPEPEPVYEPGPELVAERESVQTPEPEPEPELVAERESVQTPEPETENLPETEASMKADNPFGEPVEPDEDMPIIDPLVDLNEFSPETPFGRKENNNLDKAPYIASNVNPQELEAEKPFGDESPVAPMEQEGPTTEQSMAADNPFGEPVNLDEINSTTTKEINNLNKVFNDDLANELSNLEIINEGKKPKPQIEKDDFEDIDLDALLNNFAQENK